MGKAADKAFKRARERIVQAQLEGWERLELSAPEFEELEKLPDEIGDLGPNSPLSPQRLLRSDALALADLPGLRSLTIAGTKVSDVSALSGLTGLTSLNLAGTQVSDISALSTLTGLASLDIVGTPVSDVSALSGLTALTSLKLWDTQVSDVSPLSGLTALNLLYFGRTPVSDVSALSNLRALTSLSLHGTQVSDVSALSGLVALNFLNLGTTGIDRAQLTDVLRGKSGLVRPEDPRVLADLRGVKFAGCAAAESDPELARIAEIKDDRERTLKLFAYLGVEVEENAPEPDPLLPSLIDGGKIEIPASFPGPDEQEERLKRALHDRLRPKAAEAAQKAGNEFPRMGGKARVLSALLDRPFEELDLLAVHLEVEDIEARAKAGGEDGIPYDADLLAAVGEVTRLGPGLTRGNADVELFFARLIQTREAPVLAEVEAKRAELSDAILADPAAHGPRSLAMEARLKEAVDPDVALTLRGPKQYNLLWKLGSVAALAVTKEGKALASGVAGSLIANAYGTEITAFVSANWALLTDVAATYGAGFAVWISGTVGLLMIGKGAKIERGRRRGRGKDDGAL